MPTVTVSIEQTRPRGATPAEALRLHDDVGLSYRAIGAMWGITGSRVHQLAKKARNSNQ
ncbi:hypothetical protein LCGC14_0634410 [marine sediment metagenome]|uniref:RNA polymerase sigma-70 region 4 domain-containing protein n=1 Tax=marine sediment metagenome TaxID=412755 RepID=A0A0F9R6D4_9ZZZZ